MREGFVLVGEGVGKGLILVKLYWGGGILRGINFLLEGLICGACL